MISIIYQECCVPVNINTGNSRTACKISVVILQLLLIGGGCAIYFSGVGVIPAAVLWGSPLLIEAGMLTFVCCSKPKMYVASAEE